MEWNDVSIVVRPFHAVFIFFSQFVLLQRTAFVWPSVQGDHVIALFEISAASGGSYLTNRGNMLHVLFRFSRFDITREVVFGGAVPKRKFALGQLRYHVDVVIMA